MVQFLDFPYDFEPMNNLFLEALLSQVNDAKNLESEKLSFIGCYPEINLFKKAFLFFRSRVSNVGMTEWLEHQKGHSRIKKVGGKKVWVTFENRRIPSEGVDLSISFDTDSNGGKNLYFPLLYSYIDFLDSKASYVRHNVTFDDLLLHRTNIGKGLEERRFACTFINNPDPVRIRFIKELSRYGKIDVFGRYTNNYVQDKIQTGNNYKFVICFENDLYPGYITEKPLEGWLSRAVPVYWGSDTQGILNSAAMINCSGYNSLAEAAELVASLEKKTEILEQIIKQPLLSSLTPKPNLAEFLRQILN
jgi:hypothetical protein